MSCKHDCATPPAFPALLFNRPGLPRIEHRIGGYAEMRAHILALIDADPRLAAWSHRGADDPAIALAEGAALVGDILAFYQSLYANECYLRTAQWRDSVADLVRLTGYRLAPGLGGEAVFALLVKGERPIAVPLGFGFKAQIEGLDQPAVFETVAPLTAYPQLGSFHLYRPQRAVRLANGARQLSAVAGLPAGLKLSAGDRLLLCVPDGAAATPQRLSHVQIAVVAKTWEAFGETRVELEGGLQSFGLTVTVPPVLQSIDFQQPVQQFGQIAFQSVQQVAVSPLALQSFEPGPSAAIGTLQVQPLAGAAAGAAIASSAATMMAFKLASSHRHFGHDAPAQQVVIDSKGRATTSAVSYLRNLAAATGTPAFPGLGAAQLALDAPQDKLAAGTLVIVQGRAGSEGAPRSQGLCALRRVRSVDKTGVAWGPQSGSSSLLTLDAALGGGSVTAADIRTLNIHAVEGEGFVVRAPHLPLAAARGRELDFFGSAADVAALGDRELLLQYADGQVASARVVDTAPGSDADTARLRRITLDLEVDYERFGHDAPQVTVFGNLAHATQGESQPVAVVGDGDARQSFQSFPLPKAPLTYLLRPEETPPQHAELTVWVDGVQWTRVDTLFGAAPDAQVYVVREDGEGKSQIQFGDGKSGARLPSGRGNVSIAWRSGSGALGPAVAGTTPQAKTRLDGLDKALMPQPAVGGAAPESEDVARSAAPGRMQSLGRLVSLADYEAEALALPGVLKARARWAQTASLPVLQLTVLTASQSPADAEKLRQSLHVLDGARGARRQRLEVVQGRRIRIRAGLAVAYDARRIAADIEAAILAALGVSGLEDAGIDAGDGLFGVAQRQFGQSAHSSQLLGAVQNVEGVHWARLTALQPTGALARWPLVSARRPLQQRAGAALSRASGMLRRLPQPQRLAPGRAVFATLGCADDAILVLEHDDLSIVLQAEAEAGGAP